MNADIVELLRLRACPAEGEYLEHDHGHSDCYLEREAADEIERLRSLITEWADAGEKRANHLRSDNLTESIDKRHYDACESLRKAVGR